MTCETMFSDKVPGKTIGLRLDWISGDSTLPTPANHYSPPTYTEEHWIHNHDLLESNQRLQAFKPSSATTALLGHNSSNKKALSKRVV
ncbi:hypothetical protein BB561_001698 [Smittium simulii]|uniref:Uncharacterized protein n=1 Tax=Smittium simulii TaxID=133385 RepID=A0A2T9YTI2_9FUNG|nr:hypothetical protein BB561_001698 [Smittium simulii]